MVLATGSKPAVHSLSTVLYHSQPARLSDLPAAHVHHDAGLFQQKLNASICRLSHANLRRPEIFASLKWFNIRFMHRSCLCCWPCWFSVSGRWSSPTGNHYLQFSPVEEKEEEEESGHSPLETWKHQGFLFRCKSLYFFILEILFHLLRW